MTLVIDDEKYAVICEKVKKRQRYEKILGYNATVFMVCMLLPILISLPFNILGNKDYGSSGVLGLIGSGLFLGFVVVSIIQRKSKPYFVDDDEWAIYYGRPIYSNLVKCLKEKTKGMKEDYRKEALKDAESLLSVVAERWKVGTFKPIREFEKGSVAVFKENLEYRIIPAIRDGDDAVLQRVERIMFKFLVAANTLHIDDIVELNENMSGQDIGLPDRRPSKIGYIPRFLGFLRPRKQHLLALGFIGIVSIAILYGLLIWGLSKESAVSDTLILLGILIGAYVTIRWSTTDRTSS